MPQITQPPFPQVTAASAAAVLGTLTRNQVRYTGTQVTIPMLAEPTSAQREAFHLIGVPVPLTLK